MFCAIDRTTSTLGQQALFHRLHTRGSPEELAAFARLVERFSADVGARERAQLAVSRLQDPNGYDIWWLGNPGAVDARRWYAIFPVLAGLSLATALATVVWHSLVPMLVLVLAVVLGVRVVLADGISALGTALRQVAPLVAAGADLEFLAGSGHSSLDTLPADVASLLRLKTIARWLSGDPLMLSFRFDALAMTATAVAGMVYEYLNLVLLLDANGVYFAAADVNKAGSALLRVVKAIGDVDAAISVASWRAERTDWTTPVFSVPGSPSQLADLRHPLIENAVPNTLVLTPGQGALISGSNMSGKTTFLRTVGVNVVLAQTLSTCLASRYEAPVFDVRSCIGRADDILAGKSYYLAEVESVVALIAAAQSAAPRLFLFDEMFRGTNTVERIAAAAAVLAAMVRDGDRARPHAALAATHDGELSELLRNTYVPYHFSDEVGPDGLVFDFRMRRGAAATRNAIALLAQRGAPVAIVDSAAAIASALDARREMAS